MRRYELDATNAWLFDAIQWTDCFETQRHTALPRVGFTAWCRCGATWIRDYFGNPCKVMHRIHVRHIDSDSSDRADWHPVTVRGKILHPTNAIRSAIRSSCHLCLSGSSSKHASRPTPYHPFPYMALHADVCKLPCCSWHLSHIVERCT